MVSPQVGLQVKDVARWSGLMFRQAEERHSGDLTLPRLGEAEYDVVFEQCSPYSYFAGMRRNVGERGQ